MYGLGGLDPAGKSILNRSDYYDVPRCRGANLHCANEREKTYGMENAIAGNDVIMPEVLRNQDIFGNISKPEAIKCLPACTYQVNNIQMSAAAFPQYDFFFHQKMFCDVASLIWQKVCQKENPAYFLNRKQPNLCSVLKNFDNFFGNPSTINYKVSVNYQLIVFPLKEYNRYSIK